MSGGLLVRAGHWLVGATAAVALIVGVTVAPRPAHAVSPGAAVGIGLGAFALGSVLASPYYYGYPGYGYYPGYYYPPAYYPPAAYYSPYPRSCWNPYYGRYYPC
jgi:hypothetical protein